MQINNISHHNIILGAPETLGRPGETLSAKAVLEAENAALRARLQAYEAELKVSDTRRLLNQSPRRETRSSPTSWVPVHAKSFESRRRSRRAMLEIFPYIAQNHPTPPEQDVLRLTRSD